MKPQLLRSDFYNQDTVEVAVGLLGKVLSHEIAPGKFLSGRIVETEAYLGGEDPSCHSFGFKKTPRVQVMYYPAGHAYVYFIYGMHFCFNVVTGDEFSPEAVLIRSLIPISGVEQMLKNRNTENLKNLTNGPGKLCQALQISSEHNGLNLQTSTLKIFDDGFLIEREKIETSERIGLGAACGDAVHWPLRFVYQA